MKKKHKHQRDLCLCEYTPALSDEAAVQIDKFLQVMSASLASLLARYGGALNATTPKKPSPMSKRLNHGMTLTTILINPQN